MLLELTLRSEAGWWVPPACKPGVHANGNPVFG